MVESLISTFLTARDLLLVVLGFGLIVFVHELGHFIAARWAGIRVLAFAIGFGPAACSFRKGMGFRRGSSEAEYLALCAAAAQATSGIGRTACQGVSPTEYRFNWLPFGGYVKMLGQEDLNPDATSEESDSYQRCAVWKRMIVISAGVVMNVIFAALLFVIVFMVGLPTEPAIIGAVDEGGPAGRAVAINAEELGVTERGLRARDRLLLVNGRRPDSFNDLSLATAMGSRGDAVALAVERKGVDQPLRFVIQPETGSLSGLLEIGVEPARSAVVVSVPNSRAREKFIADLGAVGLAGVEPGMRLASIDGNTAITGAEDLDAAARASGGAPLHLVFTDGSKEVTAIVPPRAELQIGRIRRENGDIALQAHLLGLTPVLRVGSAEAAAAQGLMDGDIFLRLGAVEYPGTAQGIGEIRAAAGRVLDVVVARKDEDGAWSTHALTVKVDRKGRIGFLADDTADSDTLLSLPPAKLGSLTREDEPRAPRATSVIDRPGARVVSVNGKPVSNFVELRRELLEGTFPAVQARSPEARVTLGLELPVRGIARGEGPVETVDWTIPLADAESLHALGWLSPISPSIFKLEESVLKGATPMEALSKGLAETKRVMLTTYLTFPRLFQGTVKVEHLKGPVGIAHLGTQITSRGMVWLLFFMALISVNLAVINFLPLPIVDGGQFIFLAIEGIRGRPVSVPVQNAATLAGMLLIGSVFVIVTFNDIAGLFGR